MTKIVLVFSIFIFFTVNLKSQTEQFENLLEHRSGFGKDVTGGKGGEVIYINDLSEETFRSAVESTGPKWIRFNVSGTIIFHGTINIESDKTIDGRDADITLSAPGNECPEINFFGNDRHNLIIHNIKFINIGTGDNCGVAFSGAYNSHDIWIDHCTFTHVGDESVSLGYGSTDLTVSYCKFVDTEKGGVISWGDNEPGVSDTVIRLTIHHCYYDGANRTPALRFGKAHLYNNYISNWQWCATECYYYGKFVVENCIYDDMEGASGGEGYAIETRTTGLAYQTRNEFRHAAAIHGTGFKNTYAEVFDPHLYYNYEVDPTGDSLIKALEQNAGWSLCPYQNDTTRFTLTTETEEGGSIELSPGGGKYCKGQKVTIKATGNLGFGFKNWEGDLAGSDNPAIIMMDTNKFVKASFKSIPTHTVTVSTNGAGLVELSPEGGVYNEGTEVTLRAVPDFGYAFEKWEGDLTGSENPVKIMIDAEKNITVFFIKAETLTAYWKMDEKSGDTLFDDFDNNNIFLNEVDGNTFTEGKLNGAVYFNGNTDGIVQNASALKSDQVSIAAYIKADNSVYPWEWIAAHGDNYGLYINQSGTLTFYYYYGGDWAGVDGGIRVRDNKWHQVTGTYNTGSGKACLYVDGELDKEAPIVGLILYEEGNDFHVGSMNGDRRYTGVMDELRIYNQPLSQEEIKKLLIDNSGVYNNINDPLNLAVYPNPFNDEVSIRFVSKEKASVKLSIYSLIGNLVDIVFDGNLNRGEQIIKVNTENRASGIYMLKLNINNKVIFRKLVKQ